MYACVYVCMRVCAYAYTHACMLEKIQGGVRDPMPPGAESRCDSSKESSIYMHVCVYVCICACMNVYVCEYTTVY